jgi:hypothetical protein
MTARFRRSKLFIVKRGASRSLEAPFAFLAGPVSKPTLRSRSGSVCSGGVCGRSEVSGVERNERGARWEVATAVELGKPKWEEALTRNRGQRGEGSREGRGGVRNDV